MAPKSTWTSKELKYLKENWKKSRCREIAQFLGKKPQACFDKASQLGLRKREGYGLPRKATPQDKRKITIRENFNSPKWTVSQVKFLKENMGKMSDQELSQKLGKTVPAVYCKRRSLKIVKNLRPAADTIKTSLNNHFKSWTKAEEQMLKKEFNSTSLEELAAKLGRTEDAIKTRAYTLGLICNEEVRPRTKWTKEEVKYIKKNIQTKSYEEIGEYLGRSSAAIASKACSLKISKSPIRKKKPISLTKVFMTLSVLTNLGLISWIVYSLIR